MNLKNHRLVIFLFLAVICHFDVYAQILKFPILNGHSQGKDDVLKEKQRLLQTDKISFTNQYRLGSILFNNKEPKQNSSIASSIINAATLPFRVLPEAIDLLRPGVVIPSDRPLLPNILLGDPDKFERRFQAYLNEMKADMIKLEVMYDALAAANSLTKLSQKYKEMSAADRLTLINKASIKTIGSIGLAGLRTAIEILVSDLSYLSDSSVGKVNGAHEKLLSSIRRLLNDLDTLLVSFTKGAHSMLRTALARLENASILLAQNPDKPDVWIDVSESLRFFKNAIIALETKWAMSESLSSVLDALKAEADVIFYMLTNEKLPISPSFYQRVLEKIFLFIKTAFSLNNVELQPAFTQNRLSLPIITKKVAVLQFDKLIVPDASKTIQNAVTNFATVNSKNLFNYFVFDEQTLELSNIIKTVETIGSDLFEINKLINFSELVIMDISLSVVDTIVGVANATSNFLQRVLITVSIKEVRAAFRKFLFNLCDFIGVSLTRDPIASLDELISSFGIRQLSSDQASFSNYGLRQSLKQDASYEDGLHQSYQETLLVKTHFAQLLPQLKKSVQLYTDLRFKKCDNMETFLETYEKPSQKIVEKIHTLCDIEDIIILGSLLETLEGLSDELNFNLQVDDLDELLITLEEATKNFNMLFTREIQFANERSKIIKALENHSENF